MKPGRTVSKDSEINAHNRALERERGEFFNAGRPWNDAQDDAILEGYFLGWTDTEYHIHCGRTYKSIYTRLCKLAIRYPEAAGYTPINRSDRIGLKFTDRDEHLIGMSTGTIGTKKYGSNDPVWIAKILGRDEDEVRMYLNDKKKAQPKIIHIGKSPSSLFK